MAGFLLRRLLQLVPTLLGMSLLVFLLITFIPGDATVVILGENYSEALAAEVRHELGLDRPWPVQFVVWLSRLARGDLGTSLFNNHSVASLLVSRGGITINLALVSSSISLLIAIPLGMLSAINRGRMIDGFLRILSIVGISMPIFWFGLLLMLLFSVQLRLLPPGGSPSNFGFRAYILPAATLGIANVALLMRMTRSSLLEVLNQDYIRTARSKGLALRTVRYKHALRNAIIPVLTVFGLQIGFLLSGTVLTEFIYSLPGLGTLLIDSVYRRDFPVVQGAVLFIGLAFVITNLVVDALYVALDPRVQY